MQWFHFQVANKTEEIQALMRQFQTQKLNDYKSILASYSQIQMLYHSRSLEFYTRAFQVMICLDIFMITQ